MTSDDLLEILAIVFYFLGSQRKLALSLWIMWVGEHFESSQFLTANYHK